MRSPITLPGTSNMKFPNGSYNSRVNDPLLVLPLSPRTSVSFKLIVPRKFPLTSYDHNSVSELESPWRRLFPRAKAYASAPWIDVWVVNFGAASIPDLERLLDSLISDLKTDMPKSNDGHVDRVITQISGDACGWVVAVDGSNYVEMVS
jgi:hypothetical protein